MLPAGVAVAATPAATASTAPAPETEPATEPSSTSTEPEPEPSSTSTEPTPDPTPTPTPTPTVDPAPTPTTAPTIDNCPALPLAPFGDSGDAARTVSVPAPGSVCFTVTVERPGPHKVRGTGSLTATFSSGGTPVCPTAGIDFNPCHLAVGTYRLDIGNHAGGYTGETRIAVFPLMPGPGCTGPVSTDIGAPPTTGTLSDPLGLICHSFTAEQGTLVKAHLQGVSGYAQFNGWITDDTGKRLCSVGYACVLPAGTGGYRVLSEVSTGGSSGPRTYTVQVRRLSDPVGCAVASVTPYGSGPADAVSPVPCRTFTPTTSGSYDIWAYDAEGISQRVEMYGETGQVCDYECRLTAGVTYTVIGGDPLRITDPRSSQGCSDSVFAQPQRYTLAEPGEIDCVNLAAPQGAQLALMTSSSAYAGARMDVTVRDATGASICWSLPAVGTCALSGTAPYRALVTGRSTSFTGSYGLVVHRTDVSSACRTFPAGGFGADSAQVKATVEADAFADCLKIPADTHTSRELLEITNATGYSSLDVAVVDEKGRRVCDADEGDLTLVSCSLTPGLSHTVLLRSAGSPSEHTLTRRDVTATARGCVTTPATAVGRPSAAGLSAVSGRLVCHRVTTADARDTLHLNARATPYPSAFALGVYRPGGADACADPFNGCAVTGSTGYQVIVEVERDATATPAYRLDALRIGTAAGPAPECAKVPNVSYGFGPLVATLSEQKTAICAVLPTMSGDRFVMPQTSGATLSGTPTPRLYTLADRQDGCTERYYYGRYECEVPPTEDEWYPVSRPTVLLIGMPSRPTTSSVPVSAKFSCMHSPCGSDARTIGTVTPGTVGAGKITMKVTGTALHEKDVVELTSGSYRARSTTVSVAADRRSMVVALDLTSAPRTKLYATVVTHDAERVARGQTTVIAPLRVTAAPKVTGTVVVGGKVTATSGSWTPTADTYAYQWRANGVIIAGATASSYTLPSTLQGKQLSVSVTARKAGHPAVTAASAATIVKGVAPKATKAPTLTGTVKVGRTLTLNRGTWTPAPSSYAYQWYANGRAISGATKSWFTLTRAQLGTKITVRVTAHRTGHVSGVAWTRATAAVVG
ncbi:hypothetical protein [Streptomyces gardneri]|uniref:hypothetical protein n=1 Tax=Streptomyces gardneri TaxID=66892 RepID=UPI003401C00E